MTPGPSHAPSGARLVGAARAQLVLLLAAGLALVLGLLKDGTAPAGSMRRIIISGVLIGTTFGCGTAGHSPVEVRAGIQSRPPTVAGLDFYQVILVTTHRMDEGSDSSIEVAVPHLFDENGSPRGIANEAIDHQVLDIETRDLTPLSTDEPSPPFAGNLRISEITSDRYTNDDIFSTASEIQYQAPGAGVGEQQISVININPATGSGVRLSAILHLTPQSLALLSNMTRSNLDMSGAHVCGQLLSEDACSQLFSSSMKTFQTFSVDANGLRFYFFDLCGPSCGPAIVEIGWSPLRVFLTPFGSDIAGQ